MSCFVCSRAWQREASYGHISEAETCRRFSVLPEKWQMMNRLFWMTGSSFLMLHKTKATCLKIKSNRWQDGLIQVNNVCRAESVSLSSAAAEPLNPNPPCSGYFYFTAPELLCRIRLPHTEKTDYTAKKTQEWLWLTKASTVQQSVAGVKHELHTESMWSKAERNQKEFIYVPEEPESH